MTASRASSNEAIAPAAAAKPNQAEGIVALNSLFDDVQDEATADIVSDVKKKLPVVSNPGNWNSSLKNAESLARKCLQQGRGEQQHAERYGSQM